LDVFELMNRQALDVKNFALVNCVSLLAIGTLLAGCASTPTVTLEQQVKLKEYEKCLLLQQDNLNTINEKMGQVESFSSLVEILARQADRKDDQTVVPRFEIHLYNCLPYRP
jgi:hypothetical protein